MSTSNPVATAETYLRELAVEITSRRVGSAGNWAATEFWARTAAAFGWAVETPEFRSIDWSTDGVSLTADGASFEAHASPYSLGCEVEAPLRIASTIDELASAHADGAILLLRGELTREMLMPTNFPFYNPEEHQRIFRLLRENNPRAILAATTRNPDLAGSMYPFPLIEDGDFEIPSVYMTAEEGERLAAYAGRPIALISRAQRIPSTGCNVIAHRGATTGPRVVLFAHIDSHIGSPGAIDNASGAVILLLLAEMLSQTPSVGPLGLELVAMNGEDYYGAPGERQWLEQNEGRLNEIRLGINLDAAGYRKGRSAYSLYNCPDDLSATVRATFADHPALMEGEPWFQSDHGLFLMHGVPALAITSELFRELTTDITHSTRDTVDVVDPAALVQVAQALRDLILALQLRAG